MHDRYQPSLTIVAHFAALMSCWSFEMDIAMRIGGLIAALIAATFGRSASATDTEVTSSDDVRLFIIEESIIPTPNMVLARVYGVNRSGRLPVEIVGVMGCDSGAGTMLTGPQSVWDSSSNGAGLKSIIWIATGDNVGDRIASAVCARRPPRQTTPAPSAPATSKRM